jgi:hypothetical protein
MKRLVGLSAVALGASLIFAAPAPNPRSPSQRPALIEQADLAQMKAVPVLSGKIGFAGVGWGGATCGQIRVAAMDTSVNYEREGNVLMPFHEVITEVAAKSAGAAESAVKPGDAGCTYRLLVAQDTAFYPAAWCAGKGCPSGGAETQLKGTVMTLAAGKSATLNLTMDTRAVP